MDTFYFSKHKAIRRLVLYSVFLVLFLYSAISVVYKSDFGHLYLAIWPLVLLRPLITSVRILRFANKKLPGLIITDEYIYLLHPDANKEETLQWKEIELFRKREGFGIENVEIKLFSNDTINNLPWVKRKWKSMRLYRLFNIDILNSSNNNIINCMDWHSQRSLVID